MDAKLHHRWTPSRTKTRRIAHVPQTRYRRDPRRNRPRRRSRSPTPTHPVAIAILQLRREHPSPPADLPKTRGMEQRSTPARQPRFGPRYGPVPPSRQNARAGPPVGRRLLPRTNPTRHSRMPQTPDRSPQLHPGRPCPNTDPDPRSPRRSPRRTRSRSLQTRCLPIQRPHRRNPRRSNDLPGHHPQPGIPPAAHRPTTPRALYEHHRIANPATHQ